MRIYGPMVLRDDIMEVVLQAYGQGDRQIIIIKVSGLVE
jgi:hypothetical protein